jgi:hypothetical protein
MSSSRATLHNFWTTVRRSQQQQYIDTTITQRQPSTTNNDNTTANVNNICQSSLRTNNLQSSNDKPWGDSLTLKQDGIVRIAFRNIKSLPSSATNNRNDELILDINQGQFDKWESQKSTFAGKMYQKRIK